MKLVFDGKKLKVYAGNLKTPSGKEVYREYIDFGKSVVIIPVKDNNKIIILKQFRIPTGRWIYELPAGTLEEGEEPRECAYRELIEETGYEAGELVHLFNMYLSPGYSNEYMYVYLAKKLKFVGARPEEGEEIITEEKDLNEILRMIKNNLIEDAKSIASILYYKLFLMS